MFGSARMSGRWGPGHRCTGLERLLLLAAHVHLKPFVYDGPETRRRIDEYAPEVQRIENCGYSAR